MADTPDTAPEASPESAFAPAAEAVAPATGRFAKALEEAKAGAVALGQQAREKGGAYAEMLAGSLPPKDELIEEAKALGGQAKDKALSLAEDGKTKASDALSGLGKIVADNAEAIDAKLGPKYGDYARTAARQIQEAAAKLDAKELAELGEDAKEFVRSSPGLAIGMAAVAGFMLARLAKGSED